MIRIFVSSNYIEEKKYIIDIIFNEFLGLEYKIVEGVSEQRFTVIEYHGKIIRIKDILFLTKSNIWLKKESLPNLPLKRINIKKFFPNYEGESVMPLIYSDNHETPFQINEAYININFDILGSCFFMLTRYEEYVIKKRDSLDRFSCSDSLSYKENIIERPIVNEYVELLWHILHKINPFIKRKKRIFNLVLTHDIDKPFGMMYDSNKQILRHFAGDLLIRKDFKLFFKRFQEVFLLKFKQKKYIGIKLKTYDYIFHISKKYNYKNYFFFMNSKKSWFDGNYKVDEPYVIELIRDIIKKGHYVGLHPSFNSYKNKNELNNEVEHFNKILLCNNLPKITGARQHYLRWSNPITWRIYEKENLLYDSSLTFHDHAGFRCGTCYEFSTFDLEERKHMKLKEKPLIVMDTTLIEYMKLNNNEIVEYIMYLFKVCKFYNGDFVILWHNTTLDDSNNRKIYTELLMRIYNDGK